MISWHSEKHNSILLSPIEANYIVVGSYRTQLLWMKHILEDYGIVLNFLTLYYDNTSAINIFKNPIQHSRTKHIDIHHHLLGELMENKIIPLEHVKIEKNSL